MFLQNLSVVQFEILYWNWAWMITTDAARLVESEVNEDGYGIFISKFEIIFFYLFQ